MVNIEEVKTKKQQKIFVQFQLDLYKDCPYFVPPIVSDELKIFNPKKNANFDDCEAVYYLAYKDGKVVGRIAGILQKASNAKTGKKLVRFSRVDFVDDIEVSKALFEAVEKWAKSKKMEAVHGPLGFNDLEREGLLIEGFDQMSTFEENYYYPYYKEHLDKLGYTKDVDWLEYKIFIPDKIDERIGRISEKVAQRYGLREVKFKSKSKMIDQYKDQIFRLINDCYGPLYGVVEINEKLQAQFVGQFKLAVNTRYLCLVVNAEDKLVGFGLAFPNFSNSIKKMNGRLFNPHIFGLLRELKHPKICDFALFAVDQEYRDKGVTSFIFNKILNNFIEDKIEYCESLLQLEDNVTIMNQFNSYDRQFHKRRRCYIKQLTKTVNNSAQSRKKKRPTKRNNYTKKQS